MLETFTVAVLILFFSCLGLIVFLQNRMFIFFHVVTFLIILSIIDVFIPAIIWINFGDIDIPPWLDPLTNQELIWSILFYSVFYIIMILIILVTSRKNLQIFLLSFQKSFAPLKKRLKLFLLIIGGMFCIGLLIEIMNSGGLRQWIFDNFTVRFNPVVKDQNLITRVFEFIPWRSMFNTLCFLGFFFRFKFNSPILYGLVVPIFGILFAITTSFRGSIFSFLLGLLFMENLRIFIHNNLNKSCLYGRGRETIYKIKYIFFGFMAVIVFLNYGLLRSAYVNKQLDQSKTEISIIYKILNQGSGLQGVSTIMRHYGQDVDFLNGKTYIDMLLLPIPRYIYKTKPEWYGVADITTGMGYPKTTQPAVSIPGEAYANFGYLGLIFAIVYGLIFGLFLRFFKRKGGIYIALYPSVLIPVMFTANWMSFTGIMNMFFPTIFIAILLFTCNNKFRF